MSIFLLGDFESDNGPGMANKEIRKSIETICDISVSTCHNKITRIVEVLKKTLCSESVVICSASKLNYFAVRIAQKLRKRVIYVIHGYSSYERRVENPDVNEKILNEVIKYEEFMFSSCDRLICVSQKFMELMKKKYKEYENKFDYIYNVVDVESIKENSNEYTEIVRDNNNVDILSVGGGMKRKNIVTICDAAQNIDASVAVVGKSLSDGDKIRQYKNVKWYEHLQHDELLVLMRNSKLYVQNSIFETFGLAVIEALFSGCSLLLSKEIGCINLFSTIEDVDIIIDVNDRVEIREKIIYLLHNSNNKRLLRGFQLEKITWEWQADKWKNILQ